MVSAVAIVEAAEAASAVEIAEAAADTVETVEAEAATAAEIAEAAADTTEVEATMADMIITEIIINIFHPQDKNGLDCINLAHFFLPFPIVT